MFGARRVVTRLDRFGPAAKASAEDCQKVYHEILKDVKFDFLTDSSDEAKIEDWLDEASFRLERFRVPTEVFKQLWMSHATGLLLSSINRTIPADGMSIEEFINKVVGPIVVPTAYVYKLTRDIINGKRFEDVGAASDWFSFSICRLNRCVRRHSLDVSLGTSILLAASFVSLPSAYRNETRNRKPKTYEEVFAIAGELQMNRITNEALRPED